MEQMVPNDQKFLPIARWGWASRKPGNGIRRPGRWSQAGKGASLATVAFRERERSGNEGVGEHVRTRFHGGPWGPVKLRTMRSAPNEENLFLLPEGLSRSELLERTIQPFDLMSRRHPLSSTRASWIGISFEKRNVLQGSCDVPASSRRQFLKRKLLLLLGDLAGLLRSLLHCALRLLRLLSFLGHDALRCSVSLRALGNRNALHPEYTNTFKKTASRLRKC